MMIANQIRLKSDEDYDKRYRVTYMPDFRALRFVLYTLKAKVLYGSTENGDQHEVIEI
jgi:hypothetical protein